MSQRVKMYAWIFGCFVGFGLPNVLGEGTISDTLYILGSACFVGAIDQYRKMKAQK